MATGHLKGESRLIYTPSGGVETTHLLAVPLLRNPAWGFNVTRRRRRWEAWGADLTTREVFTFGATAVDEMAALIRMENQPALLRALLRSGLEEDVVITYKLSAGGTAYPLKLISVDSGPDAITLLPDRDRFALGEWEVSVLFRRVDGSTLEGLLA